MILNPLLVEIKPREVYKKRLCRNQDDSGAKSAQREMSLRGGDRPRTKKRRQPHHNAANSRFPGF